MYLFVILILRRDHARTLLESPPERTDRMESGTFGNLLYTGIQVNRTRSMWKMKSRL